MRYLVFRLYGPMASWGEAAVGETRPSAAHPGRSAVIGLLGAALGIRRNDIAQQESLRDAVRVGVRQESPGAPMRDYHTVQMPGASRKVTYRTRRDELSIAKQDLNTVLSSREFRCDGYWIVAVWLEPGTDWSLDALAAALRQPHFPLCLGRKALPPAAPLHPQIVEAPGLRAALTTPFPSMTVLPEEDERRRLGLSGRVGYAWEDDAGDLQPAETRNPADQPLHRGRWQFSTRPEHWCRMEEGS